MRWCVLAAMGLAGCGGKTEEDTGPTGSCNDLGTVALSSLPVGDWPAGLDAQLDPYRAISGRWEATCGSTTLAIKFDRLPIVEELAVVTEPVDPGLACGCTTDPVLPQSDAALAAHAYAYGGIAFVDDPSDSIEPDVDAKSFDVTWAFLPDGSATSIRGCGVTVLEGATHATTSIAVRIDATGNLTGTLEATGGSGEPFSCDLTAWTWLGPNEI